MGSPVEDVAPKLQSTLASFVKDNRLPGATAGVVHDGALVWTGSAGFSDIASRRVADAQTLHRVASITKTFTATAIVALRDDGLLGLDDPLVAHLPEVAAAQTSAGPIEAVTLRLLLSHQSGFQSEPPGTDWAVGIYEGDAAANLARAAEFGTRVPVSTQEKYSNLGYQLLGEVVSRRSGVPFGEFVRARITEPLGMSRTFLGHLPDDLAGQAATAYRGRWLSDDLQPVTEPLEMVSSEGGLWSCVEDLARWAAFWLEKDDDDSHVGVLNHLSRKEMRTPRYLADEEWTRAYGLGWYGVRKDDVIWVQHGGSLLGFRSLVAFDPKTRVGAVGLINGMGLPAALTMSLAAIARTAVSEAAPTLEASAPLPAAYADLLGLYAEAEIFGELIRVEWRNGALVLHDPDDPPDLELSATDDPLVFDVEPGFRPSGEPCRFERGADGRIRSMWIGGGSYRRLHAAD
ncbi:MAG TPA: serine hydrolase domain-containing protein [Candidatus Nanopelagicales bacterium]|nr:serine hydrolase domain-containing protein [Candidatus Nanopelagicales bacterium]